MYINAVYKIIIKHQCYTLHSIYCNNPNWTFLLCFGNSFRINHIRPDTFFRVWLYVHVADSLVELSFVHCLFS